MDLKPISAEEFKNKMLRQKSSIDYVDYKTYFQSCIENAKNFAVAPYFWLIPNQQTMDIVAASDNVRTLTPFTKEQWENADSFFWINAMHPDDRGFLCAAISMIVKVQETMTKEREDSTRLNVYCRMLNAKSDYRWVLIQFPKRYFDSNGLISSTLILTTDLSHLQVELKCMMTLIDPSNNKFNFFSATSTTQNLFQLDIPSITKREHEILLLMTKGLNSPEIAEKLFISYHTVENHKRNLRCKTKTKTSVELIHFVWSNNLI